MGVIASAETRNRAKTIFPTLTVTAWISTVLLILVGSIVRVTGFGLGCPDWPLCYGQAIPPGFTDAWVEFSHRVFGALTSLQIFALAAIAWREYRREHWVFRPAAAVAGLLVIQIGLGGLHVIMEIPPETGLIHTGAAMMIVGLLALLLARSAPFARRMAATARDSLLDGRLPALIAVTTGTSYLLLLTGSYVTRTGASLACLDFPLCGAVEQATQRLIDIHMLHRLTAFTVAGLAIACDRADWTGRAPIRTGNSECIFPASHVVSSTPYHRRRFNLECLSDPLDGYSTELYTFRTASLVLISPITHA
jgi:heme A synthase